MFLYTIYFLVWIWNTLNFLKNRLLISRATKPLYESLGFVWDDLQNILFKLQVYSNLLQFYFIYFMKFRSHFLFIYWSSVFLKILLIKLIHSTMIKHFWRYYFPSIEVLRVRLVTPFSFTAILTRFCSFNHFLQSANKDYYFFLQPIFYFASLS
jgi:hypothetical protein